MHHHPTPPAAARGRAGAILDARGGHRPSGRHRRCSRTSSPGGNSRLRPNWALSSRLRSGSVYPRRSVDRAWDSRGSTAHKGGVSMLIRLGYELLYEFPQATPLILNLNVHYSRSQDLIRPDTIVTDPVVPLSMYRDGFGNWCTRVVAPPGQFRITADGLITDSGLAEPAYPHAFEHTVES